MKKRGIFSDFPAIGNVAGINLKTLLFSKHFTPNFAPQ